jgi:hypothetical protein
VERMIENKDWKMLGHFDQVSPFSRYSQTSLTRVLIARDAKGTNLGMGRL